MVNSEGRRRRLSVEGRRHELMQVGVQMIASRPWDLVTMADIATAADVSKPLLYHYFSTKSDLYLEAVGAAAEELRRATRVDPDLPTEARLHQALVAHVRWVEANGAAYKAVLQGGVSADRDVQAIVDDLRSELVQRIAQGIGVKKPGAALRIALRGWVGFLESACLEWLNDKDIAPDELVRILAQTLPGSIRAGLA